MVSVIVPVYNVKKYLKRCVNSIVGQSYREIEVLLVDDGSTDGSSELCDELGKMDKRIRIIHKENGGLSSARNIAMDICKGEYLFFVDSDDYILPGILKKLVEACEKYDAEVACCGYVSGRKQFYCDGELEVLDSVEAVKRMFICNGIDANAVCKLYAKELFNNIRYPLCAYEVVPVTYKVLLHAKTVVNIYEAGYYIEKREGSITRAEFGSNNLLYVTMSYSEYLSVVENYPDLEEYAFTFFLNALISMMERAELDSREGRDECKEKVRKLFSKYYRQILQCDLLCKRKKAISFLIKIRIYKLVFTVYRKFNK